MLKKLSRYFLLHLNKSKARRVLNKFISSPRFGSNFRYSDTMSVACIVDIDEFSDYTLLFEISDRLNISPENLSIIGFSAMANEENSTEGIKIPLINEDTFTFGKSFKNPSTDDFISKEYDLLINYFNKEKIQPLLLSIATKAKLRVGFSSVAFNYSDLIIEAEIENFEVFMSETMKYITIINRK